jgi:hypothetical protein
MKKILRCFLVVTFMCTALGVSAAGTNAGFIPAPIWFSSESLSANTTTKVSTLVYNSTTDALSLTVTFYDGDIVLGKKAGIISAQSSKEFSIDWKVTVGDHAIRAHIDNPKKGSTTGPLVTLTSVETDAYRFTVLADLGIHPFETATTKTDTKNYFLPRHIFYFFHLYWIIVLINLNYFYQKQKIIRKNFLCFLKN